MANNRVGGLTSLVVDGNQLALRGNATISPSSVKREGVAGQDAVHGYTEKPVVPGAKCDITTVPGTSLETLQAITDSTVIITLANGTSYVLRDAWTSAAFEIDTSEGKFGIEFQAMSCDEI